MKPRRPCNEGKAAKHEGNALLLSAEAGTNWAASLSTYPVHVPPSCRTKSCDWAAVARGGGSGNSGGRSKKEVGVSEFQVIIKLIWNLRMKSCVLQSLQCFWANLEPGYCVIVEPPQAWRMVPRISYLCDQELSITTGLAIRMYRTSATLEQPQEMRQNGKTAMKKQWRPQLTDSPT